jgi:flagellar capping protein FliD
MEQAQASLRTLQAQQKTLESRAATYNILAMKLSALQTTLAISVRTDISDVTTAMQRIVDAHNDLIAFAEDQNLAASRGDGSSIARDPVLRGLRAWLRETLAAEYPIGGEYKSVSMVGLDFDRSGRLTFTPAAMREALQNGDAEIASLLTADGLTPGVFPALTAVLAAYTSADGLLDRLKRRLDDHARTLTDRIDDVASLLP